MRYSCKNLSDYASEATTYASEATTHASEATTYASEESGWPPWWRGGGRGDLRKPCHFLNLNNKDFSWAMILEEGRVGHPRSPGDWSLKISSVSAYMRYKLVKNVRMLEFMQIKHNPPKFIKNFVIFV